METNIRYLDLLEGDLMQVAVLEKARTVAKAPSRRHVRWRSWLVAAAAVLVVAFAIGALAQLGSGLTEASRTGSFSTVGSAVDDGVTGKLPAPSGGAHRSARDSADQPKAADLSKIVRDGTISLSVPDGSFGPKLARVVAIAHANDGFVLSSQTEGSTSGTLTIRVPAARFDDAIGQVGALGTVESSSVTGKDVTNEFVDYQAHLQNLIGRRTVLRSLLARTTTIGESLTVVNELEDVQLQIDQIEGQLRFLNNQVAESTLTVDLREQSASAGENRTNEGIQNPSLSRALDRAIQGFFGILATIIVGLGYLLPIAVIAGLVAGVVMLVRRRGRATS
jgi:Domain of unknown function (DUF4349)